MSEQTIENLEQEEVLEQEAEVVEEAPAETNAELEAAKAALAAQEDKYLRLAAEYDNYRKRTA